MSINFFEYNIKKVKKSRGKSMINHQIFTAHRVRKENPRFGERWFIYITLGLLLIASGCAPIISKEIRKNVSDELTFKEIIKNPDAYKGKIVLLSGVILGSKNTKEGTLIEILQKTANMEGRPKDVDESDGRFLALYDGYLPARHRSRLPVRALSASST